MGSDRGSIDEGWREALAGRFLVFEGPDGSGKSTQLRRFIEACRASGVGVTDVRDPGGTEVGERIRSVILDRYDEPVASVCEMLLYMASRAQLVARRIRPALERGELVVSDRFVASTLAYQGAAGGVDTDDIRETARIACAGVEPDLTIIFDVSESTASARLTGTSKRAKVPQMSLFGDRMEDKTEAFHRRVREGYLALARERPEVTLVIDGGRDEEAVWGSLVGALRERLGAGDGGGASGPDGGAGQP